MEEVIRGPWGVEWEFEEVPENKGLSGELCGGKNGSGCVANRVWGLGSRGLEDQGGCNMNQGGVACCRKCKSMVAG